MRRGNVFWGLVICLAGVILLLNTLGIIVVNHIWTMFWPLMLIVLGLWFLLGPVLDRGSLESREINIPLGNISRACVEVRHGAGRLEIGSSPVPGNLLTGKFMGGVQEESHLEGDAITAKLSATPSWFWGFPPAGFQGTRWKMDFSRDILLTLDIHTGASESYLNLQDLKVTDLILDTGASKVEITCPATGMTRGKFFAGAASLKICFPEGVAGRIELNRGLGAINIDPVRFLQSGNIYITPGFETIPNRIELYIDAGVGAITIQ
jgi:hypothetical protein